MLFTFVRQLQCFGAWIFVALRGRGFILCGVVFCCHDGLHCGLSICIWSGRLTAGLRGAVSCQHLECPARGLGSDPGQRTSYEPLKLHSVVIVGFFLQIPAHALAQQVALAGKLVIQAMQGETHQGEQHIGRGGSNAFDPWNTSTLWSTMSNSAALPPDFTSLTRRNGTAVA